MHHTARASKKEKKAFEEKVEHRKKMWELFLKSERAFKAIRHKFSETARNWEDVPTFGQFLKLVESCWKDASLEDFYTAGRTPFLCDNHEEDEEKKRKKKGKPCNNPTELKQALGSITRKKNHLIKACKKKNKKKKKKKKEKNK